MKCVLTALFLLMSQIALAAEPFEDLPPSLQKFVPSLAAAVQAVGNGDTNQALQALRLDLNPATNTADERAKFKEAFLKSLSPIASLRLKFESYDVVGVNRLSSQAYSIFGVANGKRGPVHWDFDVYYYDGAWHMLSTHFTIGWKRERVMPERTMHFETPYVLRLEQRDVAAK